MRRLRLLPAVLAAMIAGSLLAARPARADAEDTWRIATYGLGAVTLYSAVRKNPVVAILGAAGTYYAYRKWKDEVRERHRQEGRVRR